MLGSSLQFGVLNISIFKHGIGVFPLISTLITFLSGAIQYSRLYYCHILGLINSH
jgi:hypothetical protein